MMAMFNNQLSIFLEIWASFGIPLNARNVIKRLMVQVKNFHFVIFHLAENKEIIPMAFFYF